jgi:uncharacterized HhH-GPD family protein
MAKTKTPKLYLSTEPAADQLLSRDPLALLIGMVLDQQIPLEWAFAAPHKLRERLGHDLDAGRIAVHDPEALTAIFTGPPALHRFPGSMAKRVQLLCRHLVDEYDGDAARIWAGVSDGAELLKRLKALPGFGDQKAKIFLALLGKQYGVTPAGWEDAAGDYGRAGTHLSVADITDAESLGKVRAYKQEMKRTARAAAGLPEPAPSRRKPRTGPPRSVRG